MASPPRMPSEPQMTSSGGKATETKMDSRFVDALDFGQNPLAWVVLVHGKGDVILTVEGMPFARVQPIGPPVESTVVERANERATQ